MKKTALIVCTAALAAIMNFPAFAAQTKAEYKTESAQIRQDLETAGNSIKSLKEENKTISASVNAVRKAQKEAGQIKENKDTWKQVNELKDSLPAIKVSYVADGGLRTAIHGGSAKFAHVYIYRQYGKALRILSVPGSYSEGP